MEARSRFPPLVPVDRRLRAPLHRQIYDGYRAAILDGRLAPGQRLPSSRQLARELAVSRSSVVEAFDQLLAEGYCEGRVGAGTFVAADLPRTASARSNRDAAAPRGAGAATGGDPLSSRPPRPGARRLARATAALVVSPRPWLGPNGPFHLGDAAFDRFPYEVWSKLLRRRARSLRSTSLRYADAMGLPELREAIADYLNAARSLPCTADEVMIVSGSQQALYLCAHALVDRDDPVWVEDPGYWGAQSALRTAGARLVPVPLDDEGLAVSVGERRAPGARAAFVTPSHQFPLGMTMSVARRLQLLDWARRAGAWIVEDDYDSDFRYDSSPVASLHGLDRDARVLYVGTFSKVMFGGLRLGYLVLPRDLVPRFVAVRRAIDICPPTLTQAVLADFVGEGHFARHVKRMRPIYRERRETLVAALGRELAGSIELAGESAGMHVAALFRDPRMRDLPVAERAASEHLWTLPLSSCYLGPAARQGLVLGYGGAGTAEVRSAVRHLAELVRDARPT